MPELNQFAVVGRKISYRLVDRSTELFVLQRAIRRDAGIGELALFGRLIVRWPRERYFRDRFLAEDVDRGILSDSKEPGRELVLGIVTIEGEVDLHEDILSQIVRLFVAMRDAINVIDNALFIAFDQ